MILTLAEEEIDVLAGLYPSDMLRLYTIIVLPFTPYEVLLRYPGSKFEAAVPFVILANQKILRIAVDIHILAILPDFLLEGGSAVFLTLTLAGISPISHKLIKHFVCTDRC